MADGILGLGSAGSIGLSTDLIDTLKNADRKAQVEPIETRITDWDKEVEQFGEIETKINDLLAASKSFDLFSTTANAFEQVYASTTGTAVAFEASDTSKLKPGTIDVSVSQIAKKDVFQSSLIADKTAEMNAGTLSITINGETINFDTTGKTYEQLVETMNYNTKLDVGLEQVSDNEYRLIIKSAASGLENALTINETAGLGLGFGISYTSQENTFVGTDISALGEEIAFSDGTNSFSYTSDGTKTYQEIIDDINATTNFTATLTDGKISISSVNGASLEITSDSMFGLKNDSQTQKAQNMLVNVDGIDYNLSSNQVVLQNGLTISALELGDSSISIQRDSTSIEASLNELITQYNELVDLVTEYTTSSDSKIEDKSTLRSILNSVKDIIFAGDYGTDDDKSIFNYGMELDKTGHLSLNSTKFNEALTNDPDEIKTLFLGVAEDRGIGTKLKEYLDDLDSFEGLLTTYGENMTTRKDALEKSKEKAEAALDSKYAQLSAQFAAYTSIISQFENSFNGLKMMIEQSVASN